MGGLIINNKFVKDGKPSVLTPSPTYKAYRHQQQRQDHAADIVQPRVNGHPNPEFIKVYPEQSKNYFTQKEIEKYGNY